jgi:AraC-like DNA-binding protein
MRWPPGLDPDHLPGHELEVVLWSCDGMGVQAYHGHYEQFPWSAPSPPTSVWGIALAKRGAYGRRASGIEQVVDVNTGFFRRPGEEIAVSMFKEGSDELTMIEIDPAAVDVVPALTEASGPLRVAPSVDLAHRLLLRAIDDGEDDLAVQSALVELLHAGVANGGFAGRGYSRRSTEVARQSLVRETCELLHTANHRMGLVELARTVGASPFHLSRVFREITEMTLSQYRLRLRVHEVLDRIAGGDEDLASVARATGFADHSHMTRTVVSHFGQAPSALRKLLRDSSTRTA